MGPVRLRHPKGVTTIQVDLDHAKVSDLQQEIFAVTEIPPSLQERKIIFTSCAVKYEWLTRSLVKAGYPPHGLTLVPELSIESLGLNRGEQLIVTQKAEPTHAHRPVAVPQAGVGDSPAGPMTGLTASQVRDSVSPSPAPSGPDYVLAEGGYLVHRVRTLRSSNVSWSKFSVLIQIVPDDNSCLFSSIALIFEQGISRASEVRKSASDNSTHPCAHLN